MTNNQATPSPVTLRPSTGSAVCSPVIGCEGWTRRVPVGRTAVCASTTIARSWLGLTTEGSAADEGAGKSIANAVAAARPAPDADFNPVQRDGIGR